MPVSSFWSLKVCGINEGCESHGRDQSRRTVRQAEQPRLKAIEGATVFCKLRGNPYVELEHWLQQILSNQDSDLHRIVKQFDIDNGRLAKDLTEALDRLPRGATSISGRSHAPSTRISCLAARQRNGW